MKLAKNPKFKLFLEWSLLIILVAILAAGVYTITGQLESLRLRGNLRANFKHPVSAQKITPDQIRGWMTFRYINLMFVLPPGYLQSALHITNSRYPNISIDSLAAQQKIPSAGLVAKTVTTVDNFKPKIPQP